MSSSLMMILEIWRKREKYRIKGEHFEWSHATMNARTACDLIDDMLLSIKNSIWIPQYDFDFVTIWHLVHRGIGLKQVKDFLKSFNRGVKEKLMNTDESEISYQVIKELGMIFQGEGNADLFSDIEENVIDRYDAGFNY